MPRYLDPQLEAGVVAGILAGKTRQILMLETGLSKSTVWWIGAKYGLVINSRYALTRRLYRATSSGCWAKYARPLARLNGQNLAPLIGRHGNEAPCSPEEAFCEETGSPSCLPAGR